jgi:hypothetical protein
MLREQREALTMRAPPNKRAVPDATGNGSHVKDGRWATTKNENNSLAKGIQVASIDKGRGARLRISLSSWRGLHRVELRECTELVPGTYYPTAIGIMVPVDLVDDLVSALMAAKAKAIALGLHPAGRTKP